MVAIKDFEMPKSCKECPLTYLDTGDDAYFGANEKRCVIDDSCVDGMGSERAYDCPLVEAIPKDQYKASLKAEKITMLEELNAEIEKTVKEEESIDKKWANGLHYSEKIIQEKITSLKEQTNE